jgi:hypothetical protein
MGVMSRITSMSRHSKCLSAILGALAVALCASPLRADTVRPMNLAEMCRHADRIFRGTVVSAVPGTIRAGGGEIPVVTYRLRVDERFKGRFETVKGMRIAEVRMLAASWAGPTGATRVRMSELPQLEVGGSYLLLTTRPSSIGMSTTVGLKQGCFRIRGEGAGAEAVNGHGNAMLFQGMESEAKRAGERVTYERLAARIRALVGKEGGAQ